MTGGNVTKFLMFTKESCGPCGLVKKYINALGDDRAECIEEIYLEDFSDEPIPEKNLELAKADFLLSCFLSLFIKFNMVKIFL